MTRRWVQVTVPPDKWLSLNGPSVWQDEPLWAAEAGYEWMEEADAIAGGYSYPPPPDEPYVQVDDQTMTITGGPYMWNGTGTPPASGTLMPQWQAESSGYTWP